MTLPALEELYTVPIHEAASRLGVSCTTVKRIARKLGVTAWPFRRVRASRKQQAAMLGAAPSGRGGGAGAGSG
ncbi:unnamed protein product, partial [Phaeothamnion confervicola]